ncbi:MAG: radical SAM protein [Thermincola sp.]|jgi:radical SAM superfamily enzyme YgiQ (UPF0313 family)|nr:radical SAM protein [Thermincola sp.]MDT3702872.1 radical SAM protein [Thermincola sp.]
MIKLIFPPPWDTFTAYASIPVLLADLKSRGIEAKALDLNLQMVKQLLTSANLAEAYQKLTAMDVSEYPQDAQGIYRYLDSKAEFIIENIEGSKSRLEEKKYSLTAPPRIDWEAMSLATQLLSFPFYPSLWQRNTYWIYGMPKKRPQTFDDVFRYLENDSNDFFTWAYQREEILPLILEDNPSVIGVSVCTLTQVIPTLALCKIIKKYNNNIHIVLGGPFLRYIRDPIMNTPAIFDYVDSIVLGRGEETLANLYNSISKGLDWKQTPGITCLEQGQVKSNQAASIFNFNRYAPPEYSAVDLKGYLSDDNEISYSSSTGCYWGKCAFCSETQGIDGYKYMVKSPEIVGRELNDIYKNTGIDIFEMTDNAIPPQKALKLADYIIKNNLPIKWSMLARAEAGFGSEELKHLYKGGLRFVSWGIETFTDKFQKYINKGINLETAMKILQNAHEAGIWNHLFVIIGFPGESKEDMLETMNRLEENKEFIDSISLSNFHLHRNTPMFQEPGHYEISIRDGIDNMIDTSYWFDGPDVNLDMPIEGLYGLFELYLSNFHFHSSNFNGFSTAKLIRLLNEVGKTKLREYFTLESYHRTLEIAEVI